MDLVKDLVEAGRERYRRGGPYAAWAIPRRMWVSGIGGLATRDDEGWHCFAAWPLKWGRWSRAYFYRYHRHGWRFKLGLVVRDWDVELLGWGIAKSECLRVLNRVRRNFVNWKSRKLWFGIVSMILGVMVAKGVISDAQADTMTEMILTLLAVFIPFGVYTAGNVAEHFAANKRLDNEDKAALANMVKQGQAALSEKQKKEGGGFDVGTLLGGLISLHKIFK